MWLQRVGVSASLGLDWASGATCLLRAGLHLTLLWKTGNRLGLPLPLLVAAAPTGPAPEERASWSATLRVCFQAWGPVLPAPPDLFTAYLPS